MLRDMKGGGRVTAKFREGVMQMREEIKEIH
jgi:hypothetical protein